MELNWWIVWPLADLSLVPPFTNMILVFGGAGLFSLACGDFCGASTFGQWSGLIVDEIAVAVLFGSAIDLVLFGSVRGAA